jgi:predicted nucleic acid-binding protein
MRAVFADTFFFHALLDRSEARHARAIVESRVPQRQFVTTEAVLMELGDALNEPDERREFVAIVDMVRKSSSWEVVPSSETLFQDGLSLFRRYSDKAWQMTDCISFVVMKKRHLREALTGDAHFVQAGFKALLT